MCSKIESELSNKTPGGYLPGLRGLSCCLRGLQWPTFGHCSVRGSYSHARMSLPPLTATAGARLWSVWGHSIRIDYVMGYQDVS